MPHQLTVVQLFTARQRAHKAVRERVCTGRLEVLLLRVLHLAKLQHGGNQLLGLERGGEHRPLAAHQHGATGGIVLLQVAQNFHEGCVKGNTSV